MRKALNHLKKSDPVMRAIIERVGKLRLQGERAVRTGQRLIETMQRVQRIRQVGMNRGLFRIDRERPREQIDALFT